MQIVVQLLAFYLLTFSILCTILFFFLLFRSLAFRFDLHFFCSVDVASAVPFLFISADIKFFNVVHQSLPIDCYCLCVACFFHFFFSRSCCFFMLLLLLVLLLSRELTRSCVSYTRALTSHCIANHLNINNPITIAHSRFFSIFSFWCDWESTRPVSPIVVVWCVDAWVYRCHYFEFYGFDFECCRSVPVHGVVVTAAAAVFNIVAFTYHIPSSHTHEHARRTFGSIL